MQIKNPLSEHTLPLTYSHAAQIHSLALLTGPFSFLRGPGKLGRGVGKVNAFNLKYCHLDNYSVIKTSTQKAYKAVLKTKNEMQSLQIENIILMETWN